MNWIKGIGSVLLTIFIFGIVIWWLAIVLSKIGMAPVINVKGAITLDQYGRAKDILTFVSPCYRCSRFLVWQSGNCSGSATGRHCQAVLPSRS